MSFEQEYQLQEWRARYHERRRTAEARLRQARDQIQTQRDGLASLQTEILADTSGAITQAHLDEVQAQIDRLDSWIAAMQNALNG